MSCDLCKCITDKALNPLRDQYKTEHVKQVCDDCERDINKHLYKVRGVTTNLMYVLMRKYIANRRNT